MNNTSCTKECLTADDVCTLQARDNQGALGMSMQDVCKFSSRAQSLSCLRWAYMRAAISKNGLLPLTTDWPEGRKWLLEH